MESIICFPKTSVKREIYAIPRIIQLVYLKDFLQFNFWHFVVFTGFSGDFWRFCKKREHKSRQKPPRNFPDFWPFRQKLSGSDNPIYLHK